MANPFGEIAANVGKEVAEGLAKKATPAVKKAAKNVVDTVEGWGFEPKIGEISGTKYMKAEKFIGTKNQNEKNWVKNHEIKSKFEKQIRDAENSSKLNGNYTEFGYGNAFKRLEKLGVPRKYTGKIVNATTNKDEQIWMADTLRRLNPPERDVYIYATTNQKYDQYSELAASVYLDNMKDLTRPQQETFASLLPQWDQPIYALLQVVKDLTP